METTNRLTTEHWNGLFAHFVDANDDHYCQSTGDQTPMRARRSVTVDDLRNPDYAVIPLMLDINNQVKRICFDLDLDRKLAESESFNVHAPEARELVGALLERLNTKGQIWPYVEFSGGKGYHVWILLDDPVPASSAKAWATAIADSLPQSDRFHWDIFPRQASRNGGLGNGVRLPWQKHQGASAKAGKPVFSHVVDLKNWEETIPSSFKRSTITSWTTQSVVSVPVAETQSQFDAPQMDWIFEGCKYLRQIEDGTVPLSGGDGHGRRIWLANNLLAFGDAGRERIHGILRKNAEDYDPATTDKHLSSLKQASGGNCKAVRCPYYGAAGCKALRDLQLQKRRTGPYKSPIAFAYTGTAQRCEFETTDMGNAERLAYYHGLELRYCEEWKTWLIWSGRCWSKDRIGEAQNRVKDAVRRILREASEVDSDTKRTELARWALKSQSRERIKSMLDLARSEGEIPVLPEAFDQDPTLLNVENGVLDLRTGQLRPHRSDDLLTKMAPVAFDSNAKCPQWDAFLDWAMDGSESKKRFLQEIMGYALTGSTQEQKLFFFHGSGSNGKSTFLEVVRDLLGDYAMDTPTDTLMAKKGNGIPNDIARLKGARFVTAVETGEGHRLSESLVKQITGGDTVTARFLHAEFFEYRPQFKIIMSGNHKPEIRGTDKGIWRRICLVPFTVTIPDSKKDPDLPNKLRGELPGILNWAIAGCLRWQKNGLSVPADVENATNDYRRESDLFEEFLNDRCELSSKLEERALPITTEYRKWSGDYKISAKKIAGLLKQKGFRSVKRKDGNWWIGVRLVAGDLI